MEVTKIIRFTHRLIHLPFHKKGAIAPFLYAGINAISMNSTIAHTAAPMFYGGKSLHISGPRRMSPPLSSPTNYLWTMNIAKGRKFLV
ncbi:hypothetical protein SAMN05720354_1364 [Nitrosospira sp. Nsp1]|nr:hypothetical protein SAMN05720354_1364 [Nitrosospira sp. Nsp1]